MIKEKLDKLNSMCKRVTFEFNPHKEPGKYTDALDYMCLESFIYDISIEEDEEYDRDNDFDDIDKRKEYGQIIKEIENKDTIWEIVFFVEDHGFLTAHHWDLELAIDQALETYQRDMGVKNEKA